jgi:hypothetical protein
MRSALPIETMRSAQSVEAMRSAQSGCFHGITGTSQEGLEDSRGLTAQAGAARTSAGRAGYANGASVHAAGADSR